MSIDIKRLRPPNAIAEAARGVSASAEKSDAIPWHKREIHLFGSKLTMKKKEAFFLEFSILLKAGLDFKTALELVTDNQDKKDKEKLFNRLKKRIIAGASLSEAIRESDQFSSYDVYSIKIAEESGQLEIVLGELAEFYNKSLQHRRLLLSALSYPAIVIFTAILAVSFLLNFLVPMFSDVYKRLHQELPFITTLVIRASGIFTHYGLKVLLVLLTAIVFLWTKRRTAWFRRISSWVSLRLPLIGHLIRLLYLNRFCSAMSFLTRAKVPVLDALDLTRNMVSFYPLEIALMAIQHDVLHGRPLYKSMEDFSFFPKRMIALIKVGEEVNRLDQMFEKLASHYNDAAEHRIKSLGSLIEPVLIVFLALIVGLVLVAMYLPIFKLVANFGN